MENLVEPVFSHDLDVHEVADYLIRLDAQRPEPDVTPLKLAKLLYLAQANYLASTGRRLFAEDVEAFENGPVVHREWKRHTGKDIIANRADNGSTSRAAALPADVEEFLGTVWARYQDFTASALWRLTHEQAPWKDNYVPGRRRTRIPDDDMATYFRERVPAAERVFHANVVIMPDDFLDEEDAEYFAAKFAEYTQR